MIDPEEHEEISRKARKEAIRIRKLFKEVFGHDEGRECLAILASHFDTHIPSMPLSGYEPLKAAYMDGQKSVLLEINDIQKGKYDTETDQH